MAERASSGLAYKVQSALGTPATAPFQLLPYTGLRPGYGSNRVANPTIQGTRFGKPGRPGSTTIGPSIDFLMASGVYDQILASVFQGAWATDVLTQGSTRTYITAEDRQSDGPYRGLYSDLIPNEFTLRLAPGGFAECSVAFLGLSFTPSGTLSASPTAAPASEPFDSWTGTYTYAASSTIVITALELTIRNNIEARPQLGKKDPGRLVGNLDSITGSMTLALTDANRVSDAIDDTPRALAFTLAYGTTSQAWSLPILKTTGWDSPVTQDSERLQTIQLEADVSGGTKISLTRDIT